MIVLTPFGDDGFPAACQYPWRRLESPARGCGGIGRRARFRSVCLSGRGGSSPLIRMFGRGPPGPLFVPRRTRPSGGPAGRLVQSSKPPIAAWRTPSSPAVSLRSIYGLVTPTAADRYLIGPAVRLLALPRTLLVAPAAFGLPLLRTTRAADELQLAVYRAVALGVVLLRHESSRRPTRAGACSGFAVSPLHRRATRVTWRHDRVVRRLGGTRHCRNFADRRVVLARRRRCSGCEPCSRRSAACCGSGFCSPWRSSCTSSGGSGEGDRGVVGALPDCVLRRDRPDPRRRRGRARPPPAGADCSRSSPSSPVGVGNSAHLAPEPRTPRQPP